MKKIVKGLLSLAMCFSLTGCFSNMYTRSASNDIELTNDIKQVNDIDSLVDNILIMMPQTDAIKGTYELVNTKNTYKISFDAITPEKRINWSLSAKISYGDKVYDAYIKDQCLYLIYPYNGANAIIKDSMTNFVSEAEDTFTRLNATYNKDNLENLILGDKLEGFNFEGIKESGEYVKNSDNTYTITYVENSLEWQYDISSDFMIKETRCSAHNFTSKLVFEYPETVTINYPMGIDFLTVNINDVKKIMEIESFAEILD